MFTKRPIFFALLFCSGLLTLMNSCKKDDNNRTTLPDITVTAIVVGEKYIGDTTTITPAVAYGSEQASFTYKWYKFVLSNTKSKLISKEKNLFLTLDSLGTWSMKLEATNTATGVAKNSYFNFSVVSRAERGWYLLKADASGNTDMDAFLTTNRSLVISYNIITAKYGKALTGAPVALGFTANYSLYNPVTKTFVTGNSCLMPVSTKEVLAYRVKDENVIASTKDLFYEEPAQADRNFQGLAADPNLMAIVNNGKVLGMTPSTNAFLPERSGDYNLAPNMTLASYKSGSLNYILGFNQTNESFLSIRYRQTDLTYFPDVYLPAIAQSVSSNQVGGKLLFMENTDGTLDPNYPTDGGTNLVNEKAYALLRKDNSTNLLVLGLNLTELQPLSTDALPRNGAHSIVATKTELVAATYPALSTAGLYAMNKGNSTLYFTNGSTIGSFDLSTKAYAPGIYSFAGEEITYIKFIDAQYDVVTANNFRNLVVATYLNGNYKVYRFTVSGNALTQTGLLLQGTGRVKSLQYVVPNTGTPTFNNSQYRYY